MGVETTYNWGKTNADLADMTNNGQIKGAVILTQAEYDALPASKLTDGIDYRISG
jgi:metal-dependent amidase/aminoacylase/carboxypeptidase family protein